MDKSAYIIPITLKQWLRHLPEIADIKNRQTDNSDSLSTIVAGLQRCGLISEEVIMEG
jgi:hypothetical protein